MAEADNDLSIGQRCQNFGSHLIKEPLFHAMGAVSLIAVLAVTRPFFLKFFEELNHFANETSFHSFYDGTILAAEEASASLANCTELLKMGAIASATIGLGVGFFKGIQSRKNDSSTFSKFFSLGMTIAKETTFTSIRIAFIFAAASGLCRFYDAFSKASSIDSLAWTPLTKASLKDGLATLKFGTTLGFVTGIWHGAHKFFQ